MRTRLLPALLSVAVAAIASLLAAGPATAGPNDTWVYLVVNQSACGSAMPRAILGNIQPTGWTSGGWDSGDAVIYPLVRKGVRNTASLQVRCDVRSGAGWIPSGYRTISQGFTPTSFQQSIRVG